MPRSPHLNLPPKGGRILSLDLARGFTVLIMPSVHVVMLYSQPEVQQSLLGVILQFLAEGPGAQLFMLLMGVSISISTTLNSKKLLQRTIYLLIGAYALNLFKFVIPLKLGLLPDQLLNELNFSTLDYLLLGDIFQFAAIAFPICYLVNKLRPGWALIISIAIMLISPLVWDVKTDNIFVDRVLILFNGHPPQTFFPVFPWLVYSLLGIWIGKCIQSNKIGIIGSIAIISSLVFPSTTEIDPFPAHYRTRPADTLFHIGLVFLWLSLFNLAAKKIKMNPCFKLLIFCSSNITVIYILQWLLIFWCMTFTGYLQLDLTLTLIWMTGISFSTLILTLALSNARKGI